MDVYLQDQSPDVISKLQSAIKYISENKNTEGMELIKALHNEAKVIIQQIDSQGMPSAFQPT